MAQIPTGNFGRRIAGAGPVAQVNRQDPLAEATGRTLGIAVDAANENTAMQTRLDLQARDEYDRQQQEAKAAADRVKQVNAAIDAESALDAVTTRVGTGILDRTIERDKAEGIFSAEAMKVIDGAGQGLDENTRPMLQAQLRGKMLKAQGTIREAAFKRDREDVRMGIEQVAEYTQRLYRTDPQRATAQMMATIDQLGPHSDLSPAQLSKLKQTWVEGNQYTTGFEALTNGRYDRAALTKAEELITGGLPDLDPQKRADLLKTASAYRSALDQKEALDSERRAREAERHLKRAEAAFQTFQALADKGTILAPEYVDRALADTRGTPYAEGIAQLANQARETGGLAAQRLDVQEATLQAIDRQIATQGRTPDLDKRRSQVEKVLNAAKQDAKEDPMKAALERGVITGMQPLNFSGGMPALVQGLQARARDVETVSTWTGKPASPLTVQEAEIVRGQLEALPVKDRSVMIEQLAKAIGPSAAQGLAQQLTPKDSALGLAFALAGEQTTAGRNTAELVLRGQQARKDGTSTKGSKQPELTASRWNAAVAEYIGDAYPPTVAAQIQEAAVLISHGIASEQGGELSGKDIERAARLAVGGSIIEHAGKKLPIPAGFDEDTFKARLQSLSVADVGSDRVRAGGRDMATQEFLTMVPGAPLMPVAKGRYAPLIGGRPAIKANGEFVVIGIR
jgi:hypothetical protein